MQVFGIIVLAVWVVLLVQVASSVSRTSGKLITAIAIFGSIALAIANASGATPSPRVQLQNAILKHERAGAKASGTGTRILSVRCALYGASAPHVYLCAEHYKIVGQPVACNVGAYHILDGRIGSFPTAWPCGTPPPSIPPYPGDAPKSGGPSS